MWENESPYIVSRRSGRRSARKSGSPKRGHSAAGILIAVLVFLTVGICLLVVFLPKIQLGGAASGSPSFGGKTYYALAVGKTTDYKTAAALAQDAANRGGAGFLYNNGTYSAIAAVYERESDAKALTELNENSYYFAVDIPKTECGDNDKLVLEYLCGDFFAAVDTAATELDRGNATESAADFAARNAFAELMRLGLNADTPALKAAIERTCGYDLGSAGNRTVLSYIRFMTVRVFVNVSECLLTGK